MSKTINCLILVCICYLGTAQTKKYKGVFTVMHTEYAGYIYLNLSGENKGLIRIDGKSGLDSTSVSKLLSMPDKELVTFKINAALISKLVVENDTFYRRDLEDTYENDQKRKENCYVKKIYGRNDIQLFEWNDPKNKINYFFQFPHGEVLQNINHPYFDTWTGDIFTAFRRCENIKLRFRNDNNDKTKYPFYNMNTGEKLVAWKKLIDEYDSCSLKSK